MAQKLVQSTVRKGLLESLRESQRALAHAQASADLEKSRFLKVEAESPELKSGMQLLLSDSPTDDARQAMEDELRALGGQMDLDILFVSNADGTPLTGVVRQPGASPDEKGQLIPSDSVLVAQPNRGLLVLGDRIFQFASAPIDDAGANIGALSVGEYFELPRPGKPDVLIHDGEVFDFNLSNVRTAEVQAAMKGCAGRQECDLLLGSANWIGIPMQDLGGGYILWSLEKVDDVTGPILARLRNFFLGMGLGGLLIALLCSILSSRSIEKPIALVVSHLRNAEQTGVLPEAPLALSSTSEIRELAESYTRAAVSARMARWKLDSAYVEFIGSLANALDARDRYTFGHSERVSYLSRATAAAMGLDKDHVERIVIGAQLHDIGKIGVPDSVLQKPGRLTAKEYAQVKEHPVIGRRILEGVGGLAPYIDAVELHHENWDGTGYPRGQSGEETPIDARIIHVSDAYDAMTSHRSYRRRMTHEQAVEELLRCAGTQFDARIVEVFVTLPSEVFSGVANSLDGCTRLQEVAAAEAS